MTEVRAIGERRNNAELMRDCAQLGFLPEPVLDATYGLGRFWSLHKPADLTTVDLFTPASIKADFRNLPFDDLSFESVVFDPPYKLSGTPDQGGPASSDISYGITEYRTVDQRHSLVYDGMDECARLARKYLLVKCQDQVCSGEVVWQTRLFADHGETLGFRLADMMHVQGYRKQPEGRRQLHARRDYSSLLIFIRVAPTHPRVYNDTEPTLEDAGAALDE